jgi:predicted RNA-binding protein with PIN domain
MSNFRGVWATVLSGAIKAGRGALRDLDGPEIPASLQRVASYQGGSLPPPLASRLLAEIDRNDWFREKVAESFDGDPASPDGLFLERPDGWWLALAEAGGSAAGGREQNQIDALTRQIQKIEAKRDAAVQKATDLKKALADAKREGRAKAEAARRAAEARFATESEELATNRAETAALVKRLEQAEREHLELQDAFDSLRTRLAKARRFRVDGGGAQGECLSMPSDPVKLARLLDLQTASFGRTPGVVSEIVDEKSQPLTLDPGVRPDSSDAVRWLLALDEPVVIVVDGYNAQFHIDRTDFTSGGARRRLIDALKRLRMASAIKHRVVVIYDSTLPGERVARSSVAGVEVRFAEKDLIADEEIVAMAAQLNRIVVISSDREVREGAEDSGAVVLWSEALSGWLERS